MNEPAKITCKKISFEPAETLLKSEGKNLADYEIFTIRLSFFYGNEKKMCANFFLDGRMYGQDEGQDEWLKKDIKTCLDKKFQCTMELAKRMAEKFDLEYLASMKYILEADFPLIEATGLRPRLKPEAKTKTEPPPILTLPRKEGQDG